MRRKRAMAAGAALTAGAAVLLAGAGPAGACGGLVGENGTIELFRTSTLAAYTDGVERYVTSFEFTARASRSGRSCRCPTCRPT